MDLKWKISQILRRSISRYLINGPWDASKKDKIIALMCKKFLPNLYYQMVEIDYYCRQKN